MEKKLSYLLLIACIGCISFVNGGISHLTLTIEPAYAHLNPGDNLTLTCTSSEPLTHCQLMVNSDVFDASMGRQSDPVPGFEYHGRGLQAGECGFKLNGDTVFSKGVIPVTCRVRSATSDWKYALMAVYRNAVTNPVQFSIDRKPRIVEPGSELRVVYKVKSPFTTCKVTAESWGFDHKHDLVTGGCSTTGLCGLGDRVQRGECGYVIKNVTEEFNGLVWIYIYGISGEVSQSDFLLIIVAKTPKRPTLRLNVTVEPDGSETLHAECLVKDSRPAANISWFLHGVLVGDSALRYVPDDGWKKLSGLKTTRQRLTKRLDWTDEGKELWCEAENRVMLPGGLPSKRMRLNATRQEVKECSALTSDTVIITCYRGIEEQDCGQPQKVGTVARLRCKPGHALPYNVIYREISCRKSGHWNRQVFTCFPDCGKRKTNTGVPLVSHGETARIGEFPWHVGVYHVEGTHHAQICGGSLITPSIVISAAHCFWDNGNDVQKNATEYRVAAGKYTRRWEDPHSRVQKREVLEITLNLYGGRARNFAYDIAILRLKDPVEISDLVNLVCVDWDGLLELRQLQAGNVGVVSGWGFTEDHVQSDDLKYIELPYVPTDICFAGLARSDQPSLTNDKFCAGYVNESKSVCPGDSGGGLAFLDVTSNKYFLRGVVSLAFKPSHYQGICYAQQYTAFTLVSTYIPWIQRNV